MVTFEEFGIGTTRVGTTSQSTCRVASPPMSRMELYQEYTIYSLHSIPARGPGEEMLYNKKRHDIYESKHRLRPQVP